jgi:GntR family transcriptional regulator
MCLRATFVLASAPWCIYASTKRLVEGRFVIEFDLDPASGVATYLQLVQQVHQALQLGLLEPGDQLPTAQQVVAKLAINPNTVLKAYRDLEREGLVRARPGLGTFVVGTLPRRDPESQARFLGSMTEWLREARAAGLGPDDIEAIYRTAFRNCFAEGVA